MAMCQCRLTRCHECATLWGMLLMVEALRVGEQEYMGNLLTSPQFCREPGTALRNCLYSF